MKWYTADFETTTEQFYIENGYTKVWLYAIADSEANIVNYGETIEDFMKYCRLNLHGSIIYFHNLKFDGSYILNYLIKNGYPYKEKIYSKDNKCYNTLISEQGQFYQIKIHFYNGRSITIQDSLKLLPFSVKQIANDFGFELKKGIIDYNDYSVNEETLEYVFGDVKIVAMALKEIKENGMVNMTTASCAYNNFLKLNPFVNSYLPVLDADFLIEWRNAYRGGRSQVNPIYSSTILTGVKRYDVNSMYPYIMDAMEMPIGNPIKCNDIGNYKFELYKIVVTFKLKEGHLPCLLKKNVVFGEQSYYIDSEPFELLHISSIDFLLLQRHYDIYYLEFKEILGFRTTKALFKGYIKKWYKEKCINKGAKKLVAKLMLNSLYGKFGSNCKGRSKIPKLEDGILTFESTEEIDMRKYYLPIAIAITSYAHLLIDDAIIESGVDNFVYCDTDSIHTLGVLPNHMIDNIIMGKFKLEAIELKSKYVRQKTYVTSELDKETNEIIYNITCAGMPQNVKDMLISKYKDEIFNIFATGLKVESMKLMPMQVEGGIILKSTTFEIRG